MRSIIRCCTIAGNSLSKLTLTKLVEGPLEDITVQVELYVGAESYPYRYTIEVLNEVQLALASQVMIPLTASLRARLRERVQSTVYVKVTCGGRTACEETQACNSHPGRRMARRHQE